MRGASALDDVLKRHPRARLRVLVVWEPVLFTDTAPPTTRTLARLSDPRVAQFWDRHLFLSRAIKETARRDPRHALHEMASDPDAVVWDALGLFMPGTRWTDDFPSPVFQGFPVVEAVDELERRLAGMADESPQR